MTTKFKTENGTKAAETGDGWVINADITQRERKALIDAGTVAAETNDDSLLYPFFSKVVKAWPYKGDPTNPESYHDLRISQFKEVVKRVQAAFQAIVEG